MQLKIEKINGTAIKMNFVSDADDFDKALDRVFEERVARGEAQIEGVDPKDITKEMYLQHFGQDSLYEEALNLLLNDLYNQGIEKKKLQICGDPSVAVDFTTVGLGKKLVFSVTVDAYPEIKLPNYESLEVNAVPVNVTKEDVNRAIEQQLNQHAILEPVVKTLDNGDVAIIDFVGYLDGKIFEGGSAENYSLLIGSHTFIDPFEEQLVGMQIGDKITVTVTFSADYFADFLQGREVSFDVTLKEVQVAKAPELTDKFVEDLKIDHVNTVEEYYNYIKNNLIKEGIKDAQNKFGDKIIEQFVYGAELIVPEGLILQSQKRQLARIEEIATANNVGVDVIFNQYGIADADDYFARIRENCDYEVRRDLVLMEVAKVEKLKADKMDYEKEIMRLNKETGRTVDELKSAYPRKELTPHLLTLKAEEFIKKHASIRLLVQTDYD